MLVFRWTSEHRFTDVVEKALIVDLSVFGHRRAGVSLYSVEMAQFLEAHCAARVVCSPSLSGLFAAPMVCPPPLEIKNSTIGRSPVAYGKLFQSGAFYCPHDRLVFGRFNQIITLHDTIAYAYPTRNLVEWCYYRFSLPLLIKQLAGVFSVSESSKASIVKRFGIRAEKIHVVPNGIDLSIWSRGHKANAANPYILAVSANRPYKNTLELIEHHRLWSRCYRLKILGSRSRYGMVLRGRVARLGLQQHVDFMDDLAPKEVVALYRGASLMVYPSTMEGFGRPPLEAMAVGCPVILSDIAVHRECFAGAGIFITPGSAESWANAFKLAEQQDLLARNRLQGYDVARRFSMSNATARLRGALKSVWPRLF